MEIESPFQGVRASNGTQRLIDQSSFKWRSGPWKGVAAVQAIPSWGFIISPTDYICRAISPMDSQEWLTVKRRPRPEELKTKSQQNGALGTRVEDAIRISLLSKRRALQKQERALCIQGGAVPPMAVYSQTVHSPLSAKVDFASGAQLFQTTRVYLHHDIRCEDAKNKSRVQ